MRGFRRKPKDPWREASDSSEAEPLLPAWPGADGDEPLDGARVRFGAPGKIALLLVLLAGVSAAAIVGGRALTPAAPTTPTRAAQTTTAARPVRRAVPHWGPFALRVAARFVPTGGTGAALAFAAGRLVLVAGSHDEAVFAGPLGGRLARVATLAVPHAATCAFGFGSSVYLIGGEGGAQPNDLIVRVDARSGQATQAGVFEEPIAECGIASDASGSYLVGGWTGQRYATAILRVGPSGVQGLLARLPSALRFPAVALVGKRLYVAGGATQSGLSRAVVAIDTGTGRLVPVATLPQGVEAAVLVPSGSSLYLLGGQGAGGKALTAVVRIDPASGATSAAGRLPRPLPGAASVRVGNQTLVLSPGSGIVYSLGP
jgi:outer membrane protein assembly factor BamB